MILKPLCCGILPRRGAIQSRVSFASTVKAENMDDYSFTKKIYKKQAWKLSAIKGEPNLSILWEVRLFNQIWQKAISVHKASSNLTKVFLAEKHYLLNSNFCKKDISSKTKICPKSHFWLKSQFRLKSQFWSKEPILAEKPFLEKINFWLKNNSDQNVTD